MLQRFFWPWDSLVSHAKLQWEFNEPVQSVFLVGGLCLASWVWIAAGISHERRRYLILVWTGIFLTATTAGVHPKLRLRSVS